MKRCYDSGAAKRKRREHAINELSKQKNSLDAFISRRHVDDQNGDYAVSLTANTGAENSSCHLQSSTNMNVTVGDHFLQTGPPSQPLSMTSPFLTEVEYHSDYYEMQAEIIETNATNHEFNLDLSEQTYSSNNDDEEHEVHNNVPETEFTEVVYNLIIVYNCSNAMPLH